MLVNAPLAAYDARVLLAFREFFMVNSTSTAWRRPAGSVTTRSGMWMGVVCANRDTSASRSSVWAIHGMCARERAATVVAPVGSKVSDFAVSEDMKALRLEGHPQLSHGKRVSHCVQRNRLVAEGTRYELVSRTGRHPQALHIARTTNVGGPGPRVLQQPHIGQPLQLPIGAGAASIAHDGLLQERVRGSAVPGEQGHQVEVASSEAHVLGGDGHGKPFG